MTQQHTPEPWSYQASIPEEGYECFWILSGDRQVSAFDGPQSEKQFANVRRVIACVNACAGVSTEYLEGWSKPVGHLPIHEALEQATKRSDELLAALVVAKSRISIDRESLFDCHKCFATETVTDELGLRGLAEYDDTLRTIEAAIPSAKGGA